MAKKKRYYNSDSMMSNSSGRANMPQEVIMKDYPKNPSYLDVTLNDGMSGIDAELSSSSSKARMKKTTEKF